MVPKQKEKKKAAGQHLRENKKRRENVLYTASVRSPQTEKNKPTTQVQGRWYRWYCRETATETLEEFLA